MTEFIIGSAGSGKSTLVYERIVNDLSLGKRVILLVPEQSAVNAEAAVCALAQKKGVPQTELEVLNFKRLSNRVFREYGGIAYNSISGGAKALVVWKALFSSAPFLKRYLPELEDARRFVPTVLSAISEFKAYGITPEMLSSASRESEHDDPELSEKLFDLSVIYSQYSALLKEGFTDPSDDLTKLYKLLSEHDFFKGVSLYLDSYAGFTPKELSVLSAAFRQSENVTVSLCISEDAMSFAFENIKDTYKQLQKLAKRRDGDILVTRLASAPRYASPALSFLEKNLWSLGNDVHYSEKTDDVRAVISSGIYSECEFVANDISKRIREGAAYRDFAVVARSIDSYRGVVDALFSDYGLPCHISDKTKLSEKPIFKLILSAFNIKNNGWRIEDVVSYMKTGLSPVTPDECDALETYAYQWNIFGEKRYDTEWFMNPEGYTDSMTEESLTKLEFINSVRNKIVQPLVKLFESFDGTRKVSELCRVIYEFLLEIGADEKIAATENGEEIRIWNLFCDSLDILGTMLPDTKAGTELFANLFTLVVDQTSAGNLPSGIDEITVGSSDLIRLEGIKHIYLLGVNEGVFPATCGEGVLFSDNEKAILEGYGIVLSPDSNTESVTELYSFYKAATSASETVTVICSSSDLYGEALKPSVAFLRICELFPNNETVYSDKLPLDFFIQKKEPSFPICLLSEGTAESAALSSIYREEREFASLLDTTRQGLVTDTEILDNETAEAVFSGDLALTQSRLDRYVMCAFGYECDYIMKLKPRKKFELRASDTGTVIHRILEKFFASAVSEDGTLKPLSEEEKSTLVDEIISEYISAVLGGERSGAVNKRAIQLFVRLKRSVMVLINNLIEEFSQSEFVPRFFEMKINDSGDDGTVAPIDIPLFDGTRAYIYGVADRVDICKKGNDVYVRVVDYKTGSRDFSLYDVSLGLNLQMLLYLFSIWKDKNGAFKRSLGITGDIVPTGVLYCTAKTSGVTVKPTSTDEEILTAVSSKLKRNGLLIDDEEILRLMEAKLAGKYIPVSLKKDGEISSSSLASLEEMGKLLASITDTVARLASQMKAGEASCRPLKDNKHDACKFCEYKTICRSKSAFTDKQEV